MRTQARRSYAELIRERQLPVLALVFGALMVALSGGYGYDRDELYFIAIGGHPAFGYVDEPPLAPLLAHAIDAVSGHSLVWLRVPAAVAGAMTVLVTGLIAREFRADARAQLLAASCMAVSAVLVSVSHLASTSGYDLLAWTVVSWLVVHALVDDGPVWLAAGAAAGIALEIKTLPIFLLAALFLGVLLCGPRTMLRSPWLAAGAALAVALWAPNLIWQAKHGWPQLHLAAAIASGHPGTSSPRWLLVPYQAVLVSPPLIAVWVAGLVRLARDRALAPWRCFAAAYPILAVTFVATGGKPYYLCGLYPVLLAAGAEPALAWVRRGAHRIRAALLTVGIGLSAAVSMVLMLPVVPVRAVHATPIVATNYDAGETVGWPEFASHVAAIYLQLPPADRKHAVVLAENYGEAGALLHYEPAIPAYSGQDSLWTLGPPPSDTAAAVAVGYTRTQLRRWFLSVVFKERLDNGLRVDNDEQGRAIWVCTGPIRVWPSLWSDMRRLG